MLAAAGPTIDLTQAVPGYPTHPDLAARLARATVEGSGELLRQSLRHGFLRSARAAGLRTRRQQHDGDDSEHAACDEGMRGCKNE